VTLRAQLLKSVCRVRFVAYQGAFAMALRVLDWDLCIITMLDVLAQAHIRTCGEEICRQAVECDTKHASTLMIKY
jgi:hypothetical protein